jgi:hypothetical protein
MTVGESINQKSGYDVTDQSKRTWEARHEDLKKRPPEKGAPERRCRNRYLKKFPLEGAPREEGFCPP